ncbi:hypothetical protein AAVH_43633, partial [Aphelenchoides avenae]
KRLSSPRRPATDVGVLRHVLRRRAERAQCDLLRSDYDDVHHRHYVPQRARLLVRHE